MSRQLDQVAEARTERRHQAIVRAVEFEMVGMLAAASIEMTGFSVKIDDWQCLLTVRAVVAGVHSVAFVGADDLGAVIIKLVAAARSDKLVWREDKYRANVG